MCFSLTRIATEFKRAQNEAPVRNWEKKFEKVEIIFKEDSNDFKYNFDLS